MRSPRHPVGTACLKDASARKGTLEGYIEMADSYWEKAEAADTPELELQHLRSIEGFWPDSPDLAERIAALQGKVEGAPEGR